MNNKNIKKRIKYIFDSIPSLTDGQTYWLVKVLEVFKSKSEFTIVKSDIIDEHILHDFGDALRIHHSFSVEPFSKDKFEYVLERVLNSNNYEAKLAPKGNPGYDITIDDDKISLKTQADKSIREDIIWISKFMELGKGQWGENPKDLNGLRKSFFTHIKNYDRIFTLRTLSKDPNWFYELVEIPKSVLTKAKKGKLVMKMNSKQFPKPGYCYVKNSSKEDLFQLYFDGGSERKLQIKNLKKSLCVVHATWKFSIPKE